MPNRSFLEKRKANPARARERRQQQCVSPDDEPGRHARERTGTGAFLPEQSAEQGGGELCDGSEGDEPDRDQRIRLARDAEVQVAEQQNKHDGTAADGEQQP